MTYALVEDILEFVNVLLGSKVLKTSEYIFRGLFEPKIRLHTHIYCPKCDLNIGEQMDVEKPIVKCVCGHDIQTNKLTDIFFVTLSISDLLAYQFKKPDFKLMEPRERYPGKYEDVMDGELYSGLIRPEVRRGKNVLTLLWNTNGAKVFRSPKGSMWPLQFVIREIDPTLRFRDDNVLLCGLYFGKKTPNMTCLLKPFQEELVVLADKGVEVVTSSGDHRLYHVYATTCSVDSGAKPKIIRQKAHNGKFACGYGLHPNLRVPGFRPCDLQFVVRNEENEPITCETRSHDSVIKDMLEADRLESEGNLKVGKNTQDHVNGLLGVSICAGIPKFNLVWGVAIDYLHTVLLGVMAGLIKLSFDTPSSNPAIHDPKDEIKRINKRLLSIKPPQAMATPSKSLDTRSDRKGKQLRLFGLYYALPCLKGLRKFSERHYEHLRKFVIA